MAARKKGDGWYADFMVNHERHRCFGFESKIEADTWEANARLAIAKGHPLPNGPASSKTAGLTLDALIRHCARVHWSDKKSSAKLIRNAELYSEFTGPLLLAAEALTTGKVAVYATHLKETGRSGSTLNRHLSSLSVLVKHGLALGVLQAAPLLPWQREGEGRLRYFEKDEEALLFGTLAHWGKHRELALLAFLVDTGARLGEAMRADPSDVTLTPPRITFWDTKNGKNRTVPLTRRALAAFQEGPGFKGINPWGLRSTWERLRTHHEWIGDASVHTFRHTCASRLVQSGVDLYRVQQWMGHKSIATTQRYAHLSPKHLDGMVEYLEAAE